MINILQEPGLYQPAYNDLTFVVSGTNCTQDNFNYIADLYITGVTEPFRLKAIASPVYGSGVFNFGRVVENYVNSDISTAAGFNRNSNSYAAYHVSFGEEYGTSGAIQYPNIATTSTKYVWNGILDFIDYNSYNYNNYLVGSGVILNKTIDRNIELNQNAFIYYIANTVTNAKYSNITTYNSAGSLIGTYKVTNPYQTSGTIDHHYIRFACGTKNLNDATLSVGSQPVIDANVSYYRVAFEDSAAARVTPYYRFNVVSADCRYTTYRLHFLNELGAFESFNFSKVSRKSIDISRSKYKTVSGSLTSAITYGYSLSDRLEKTYSTSMKEGLKLKTDWLTDEEHEWLQELITSPEIYLDDSTLGLIAVTCNASKIDVKTRLNDKLFNLEIEVEYTFNRYRQRG